MLSEAEWAAIRLSLLVSTVAVLTSFPFGLLAGWLLARYQFWGKTLLETVLYLPLVLPPVVTGYLLLVTFGKQGCIGSWLERWFGISIIFDWKGAAVASAIISFPLMLRALRVAISNIDVRYEQVARTLGASRWDCFLSITLPLALPGIIAGCVLAFARSLGEFGATIMLAGNIPGETRTIPLHIYTQLETPGGIQSTHGIIFFSIIISAVALYLGEYLEQRQKRQQER